MIILTHFAHKFPKLQFLRAHRIFLVKKTHFEWIALSIISVIQYFTFSDTKYIFFDRWYFFAQKNAQITKFEHRSNLSGLRMHAKNGLLNCKASPCSHKQHSATEVRWYNSAHEKNDTIYSFFAHSLIWYYSDVGTVTKISSSQGYTPKCLVNQRILIHGIRLWN